MRLEKPRAKRPGYSIVLSSAEAKQLAHAAGCIGLEGKCYVEKDEGWDLRQFLRDLNELVGIDGANCR